MALEEFFTHGGKIVSKRSHTQLKIGTEVLAVNSHVDGRYTCVGRYVGRPKENDSDVTKKSDGYDNFVLEDTTTLPMQIVLRHPWEILETNNSEEEYIARVIQTIKERGIKEGKTLHALDLGTSLYRVK